jgi:hypothetical protein
MIIFNNIETGSFDNFMLISNGLQIKQGGLGLPAWMRDGRHEEI